MSRQRYYWQRKLREIKRKIKEEAKKYPYPIFYWPTQYKVVTQAFGINPQWYNKYGLPGHEGIDMRALRGTPIYAVWDGNVSRAGWHDAYGNHIRVFHLIKGIKYESVYAHLFNKHPYYPIGTKVKRGQIIGDADSTGNSTGDHLHFSLKQYNGVKPDTKLQNAFDWPYDLIDPTVFFKEIRDGYE